LSYRRLRVPRKGHIKMYTPYGQSNGD